METIILGIAGGSASGKTSIAKKVYNATKKTETVCMIKIDDYYKKLTDIPLEERAKINYDHPDAYDINLLVEHLNLLKQGKSINKPVYDFINHNRSSDHSELIKPANIVILEGILTLAIPEIEQMCDIKLYIDTPDDIRFIRRLKRDTLERGRSMESVINQYLDTVRPMHNFFVEPSKIKANLIIPEGGKNQVAIDFIISRITDILNNSKQ